MAGLTSRFCQFVELRKAWQWVSPPPGGDAVWALQPLIEHPSTTSPTGNSVESLSPAFRFQAGIGEDHPLDLFQCGLPLAYQFEAVAEQGFHAAFDRQFA